MMPCAVCQTAEHVNVDPDYVGWRVTCSNCYEADCIGDPPRFVSDSIVERGATRELAIEAWNERMRDEAELEGEEQAGKRRPSDRFDDHDRNENMGGSDDV